MSFEGRVSGLHSYPVKSMTSVDLDAADVTPAGLDGDRGWSVVDGDGAVVSARKAPSLREVRASAEGGHPVLDVPGVASGVSGADADAALSTYLGASVRLAAAAQGSLQEVAAVHLVSRQAVAASIGTTSDNPACDIEAPRANITIDLPGDALPEFERAWVGQEVVVGTAVLRVTRVPQHCLGVYAEVVAPGRVNLGDAVRPRD